MRKASYPLIACLVILLGCGGTQYRDPTKDKGSIEWGPKEIQLTVNKMVASLYDYLKKEWKQATFIKVQRIRNKTSEHIDTELLADQIVSNLLKKRIQFIDDSYTKEAIEEMERGLSGMIDPDSAIPVGQLKSPNFFLFGEIRENVRYVRGKKLHYLVVTLKLHELKTRLKRWQERQEFLKATRTKRISF